MKKNILVLLLFFLAFSPLAETYDDESDSTTITRIPVWVFLETVPGATTENAKASLPPRKAITELSSFLLSGFVFGWEFKYVPYDKTRQVKEHFEIKPKHEIPPDATSLKISELTPKYPYLYCYAEYTASEVLALRQQTWECISYKVVQGTGTGERIDEVQGIYNAYINAVKDAVRRHARSLTKNKPREICGQLMLRENPRLFMKSGTFYASLEMNIYIEKIFPYTMF